MKKLIIFILFLMNFGTIKSQNDLYPPTIIKVGITKDIYGLDLGYVNENSIYQTLNFSIPLIHNRQEYMGYGLGYVFKSNVYGMGLIGFSTDFKAIIPFYCGLECGYMTKNIVGGVFYTNTTGLGVKIGYIFDFNEKRFGSIKN